ncbi:MAG: N-acetylglucosaminyltransferase, partial [Lachnospiraceae bacterium]|nr:N-acetylglucosaminyltransferase [Lachnospiraceae bacterium]
MISLISELPGIILTVLGAAYTYMTILMIVGFFSVRRFPEAKHNHCYAILIAARNEENVIGQLLQSIHEQTYPAELTTVFVVADN